MTTLTTKELHAVEDAYSGGLVSYVQRLRVDHGPTFYEKVYDNDGKLGMGVCRCGEPECPIAPLLVHIDALLYAYELKVQDFARETARKSGQAAGAAPAPVNQDAARRVRGLERRIEELEFALRRIIGVPLDVDAFWDNRSIAAPVAVVIARQAFPQDFVDDEPDRR